MTSKKGVETCLVIDGRSLSFALEEDLAPRFLQLGSGCTSVVCCRVSPLQKALVTKLVKDSGKITLAIGAVYRRIVRQRDGAQRAWLLDAEHQRLTSPEGDLIELGDNDVTILSCFPSAEGGVVSRETLCERLGRPVLDTSDNGLHAMIYRLRRRIEKVTGAVVPLQSQSRVGYVFKAPIRNVPGR